MKVVYIVDQFPVVSETFILNEILEIQKKGVEIEVISLNKPINKVIHPQFNEVQKVTYLKKVGLLTKLTSHLIIFKRPLQYFRTLALFLSSDLRSLKFFIGNMYVISYFDESSNDHIHAHFGLKSADVAMLVSCMTGIPYTFTSHRYDIFDTPPSNYRLKSILADKHITISDFNKEYLIKQFNIPRNKIEVIHCGVNFSRTLHVKSGILKNTIISIARLEKVKALENLIEACALCKKRSLIFNCIIIGDGSERTNLEVLIKQLKLENNVKLLGAKPQYEVFELLSQSAMMVLPSRSEGISVSVMEAMAMKVPVIGPLINGMPELVQDGENGYLIPPDDAEMLSDRIERLLKDENLRKIFSEKAYLKVYDDFNLGVETDKLLSIWKAKGEYL